MSMHGKNVALKLALVMLFAAAPLWAHDIPNDVAVHAFLKPEGQHLRLLVRVPMAAMRDITFATLPNGYVDLERVGPSLQSAAKTWVAGNIELYEGDDRLPEAVIVSVRASIQSDRSIASYE